ncbi:glycosyltransferase family 4 protein [Salinilacihabitans rarus]|uniref:glycosyltransferase family 4 protein n=1 Tax=Salinilacihabitans rarus TaxID=2961596 RepID=UPI0020C86CE5|nr:glycosyltransferase family 4 protein [Salinilacihabitans rarus]
MRIAFVSFETVHHRASETNERFRSVVELLRDRGHDVHVFCAQFWADEAGRLERDGITYHGVSVGLDACESFLLRLPVALRATNPDVVHAGANPPGQVLAARSGATLSRAPLLVEWYGDGGVEGGRRRCLAARASDRIVTPSELVRRKVRELGADGNAVDVVPNGVDVERVRETDPGEEVDVVYARRLDAGANLESLLLALAELRDREWRARVLGDGPERDAYEELAGDLRIDDRVEFAGDASLDERIAAYRGAHVFAQTAQHCVFPTEMLWALAAGCVGVVEYHTDSCAHELLEGCERGFRTTSEEELADVLLEARDLEHRDYDERFAEFDHEAVGERYLDAYRDLREDRGLF